MILISRCRSRQIEIRLKMDFGASKNLYQRPFSRFNSPSTRSVPTNFSNLTYTKAPDQKIWCTLGSSDIGTYSSSYPFAL